MNVAAMEAWAGQSLHDTNRLQQGWNSVSVLYKLIWFATIGLVVLGIAIGVFALSATFICAFQAGHILYFLCKQSSYQSNIRSVEETEARLDLYVASRPTVVINVRAGSESDKGQSIAKETFEQDFEVTVRTWEDSTKDLAAAISKLHEHPWTKVKVLKLFRPDENFYEYRHHLYNEHKGRGQRCETRGKMELTNYLYSNSWEQEILCRRDSGTPVPLGYHPSVKWLAYLLVLPALPYRIWFGSSTGKVRVLIQKSITTPPLEELLAPPSHEEP